MDFGSTRISSLALARRLASRDLDELGRATLLQPRRRVRANRRHVVEHARSEVAAPRRGPDRDGTSEEGDVSQGVLVGIHGHFPFQGCD